MLTDETINKAEAEQTEVKMLIVAGIFDPHSIDSSLIYRLFDELMSDTETNKSIESSIGVHAFFR